MITRFIIWLEDTYDELAHNHILKIVWKFPLWFHELLAKKTKYRVIRFLSIDNIPYRWEFHKTYPIDSFAYRQQSRVDKEPKPLTLIEILDNVSKYLEDYVEKGNYPSPVFYEIWYKNDTS